MTTSEQRLIIDDLSVAYGSRIALADFSASFGDGRISCVLGPNGAGKSTLIGAIAGRIPTASGRVILSGRDVTGDPDAMIREVSFATQEARVLEGLTPSETLSFVGSLRGLEGRGLASAVNHLLEVMHLDRERATLARDLSGGMRRKLAVACALIGSPAVILLDESFAGLDPEAVRLVEDELRSTANDGSTILLVTHRLDLVYRIAERVLVLIDGQLRYDWTGERYVSSVDDVGGDPNELYLQWVREARGNPEEA
jgi:ABC-type multidrug transport system ATPase subunit